MKSFFISVNFFCRNAVTIVKIKVINITIVKAKEGIMNRIELKI